MAQLDAQTAEVARLERELQRKGSAEQAPARVGASEEARRFPTPSRSAARALGDALQSPFSQSDARNRSAARGLDDALPSPFAQPSRAPKLDELSPPDARNAVPRHETAPQFAKAFGLSPVDRGSPRHGFLQRLDEEFVSPARGASPFIPRLHLDDSSRRNEEESSRLRNSRTAFGRLTPPRVRTDASPTRPDFRADATAAVLRAEAANASLKEAGRVSPWRAAKRQAERGSEEPPARPAAREGPAARPRGTGSRGSARPGPFAPRNAV